MPKLSKVYERLMSNQIYPYFETLFSKFQCGFRKGFSTQYCLLARTEKWRKNFDKGGETGAVLTDLSKAFDCIDHNLLIAKLDVYGFEKQSIDFFHLCLTKCKQRTKVDSAYSSWEMLLSGVLQGSILGPLLFNMYICNMFFETPKNIDFAGYADDNTPYTCSSNIEEMLENLQGALEQLFRWFSANRLVANAGKCHLLTSSKKTNNIAISNTKVSIEQKVKLLGINLESKLDFDYHVNKENSIIQRQANRTVYFGTEISSLAPKFWELIPSEIKNTKSLNIFKEKIKSWTTNKCPSRLCKMYVGNIDFI